MVRNQFILDLNDEIIVDNFAGGGGASMGIEDALGRHVDVAVNHDTEAIAMHTANHPQTHHECEDVFVVDPKQITKGRPVGFAWFSPDCKDFSKAKGGKPRSKKIRGLAWVMLKWAALLGPRAPRVMVLENVEEFAGWGPLLGDNSRDPQRAGETFRAFIDMLTHGCPKEHPAMEEVRETLGEKFPHRKLERGLGYKCEWKELRACDYGAPTIRKRLFLIARRDGKQIVWPQPTHGNPKSEEVRSGKLQPWRVAAECIDWSIPCPSIFLTKEEARPLRIKRPLAGATEKRVARGIRKFVIESDNPFIIRIAHGEADSNGNKRWGDGAHSIDEPLGTIPASNEFGLVAPHITKFRTGATGSSVAEPIHTITSGPKDNPAGAAHAMGLVEAKLAPFLTEHANGSNQRIFDAHEPLRTQCGEVKGGHFAVAAATLVQTGYGERDGQLPRVPGIDKPLGTIVGGGQKHAAVTAFLAKHYGGHETPGSKVSKPFDTLTTKDHHAVVASNLVRHFGQSHGADVEKPVPTIPATGMGKTGIVTSHLAKMYDRTPGQDNREPMHTITSTGQHIAEVRAFLIKYYGNEKDGFDAREPMHTIPTKDRIGLVTIHGEDYVITDIGMRMLQPRELFLAQGFPSTYIITFKVWKKRGKKMVFVWLPKDAQVRMVGNSVSPPLASAITAANVPELSIWGSAERAA